MAGHRGGGIYFQLAIAMSEEVTKRGSAFGFGFATDQTRALSIEFLGFDLVGPIHRLAKVLDYGHYAGSLLGRRAARMARRVTASARRGRYRRRGRRAGHIAAVDRFDERFDDLAAGLTPARFLFAASRCSFTMRTASS